MRLDSEVIPIRERSSMLFLRCGRLDVEDGALVLVDTTGVRMQIPLGGIVCLLLEPGTVFPTHVGMNRRSCRMGTSRHGVPHARGDEPGALSRPLGGEACSPRTWG